MEAISGLINSGNAPAPALWNFGETLLTGKRSDPGSIAENNMRLMYHTLKQAGFSDNQALLAIMNPKTMEQAGGAVVNPSTSNIGNTVLQNRPGGGVTPVFREPGKPELVEGFDPKTGRPTKQFVSPPEPFGGYGVVGPNMVVPGRTPGAPAPTAPFFSGPSAKEREENLKLGGHLADESNTYQQNAMKATSRLTTLSRLSQLTDKIPEGKLGPLKQDVKSLAASLGWSMEGVKEGDEFNAIANKMVLDANNGSLGVGVSNADVKFLQGINPSMSHTAVGRREIIDTLSSLAKRDQQTAKMAKSWRDQYGTIDGFANYLSEWSEKNPLFKSREPIASFSDRFGAPAAASTVPQGWSVTVK